MTGPVAPIRFKIPGGTRPPESEQQSYYPSGLAPSGQVAPQAIRTLNINDPWYKDPTVLVAGGALGLIAILMMKRRR